MTQRGRLGVAVVGLGVGEQHARSYALLDSCRLAVLCDIDQGRAHKLAQSLPGATVLQDFASVIADPDVDILSIASYDHAHFDQVKGALEAGKHVFVEKPLCTTRAELIAIGRLLNQNPRLHLDSNLVLRGAPVYHWLRDEIRSGAFGEIYAFDGDYLYGRLEKITHGWRKDSADYSVMLGGGIHLIDLLLLLTGQRPQQVACIGNAIATHGTAFGHNDFAAATMTFASGLVARITANFGCVHRHQHVVRIFGTRKTFLLDDAGPRIIATRDTAIPASLVPHPTLPASKGVLIPGFVRGIELGDDPDTLERRAVFDGISVALACDEAMATGKTQMVDYA